MNGIWNMGNFSNREWRFLRRSARKPKWELQQLKNWLEKIKRRDFFLPKMEKRQKVCSGKRRSAGILFEQGL